MVQQCGNSSRSLSIFFPMEEGSSVDCTLSLGTPSTRQTNSSVLMPPALRSAPSFCWDIVSQSRSAPPPPPPRRPNAHESNISSNSGGDPLLLARRCANCHATSTPLWRNGPRGPKSLCNACGIRYKKEERRAAASSTTAAVAPAEAVGYTSNYQRQQQRQSWDCYADEDMGVPYLSWRLNAVPPTSLFQYQ